MAWTKKGIWIISKSPTLIPIKFKSRLIFQVSNISNLKSSWFWAGFFYQYLTIPPIGLVRFDEKINVPIREPVIYTPQKFEGSYQLKFNLADWIDSLTLTIYEDSMGLNVTQESIIFPNQVASSATSTTVPVTATSVVLLPANANRKKFLIENNSNQDLYIDFDSTCSVADHGQKLAKISAGGAISSWDDNNYTGVVSGIWAAPGAGAANIREFI